MPDLLTTAAIAGGKVIIDATKPQQSVFLNYIFLHWLGGAKMLIANETVKAEVENAYDLKKLEGQITRERLIYSIQSADEEIEGQNMLGVLERTLPKLNPGDRKREIDPDKIKRLKDLSKEFSSDDMQEIVSGILAGEYNNPGTYSLKTMSVIKNLSRDEINLFRKFCGLLVNREYIFGNFFHTQNENHTKLVGLGIMYSEYLYLQELGLFAGSDSSVNMGNDSDGEYIYTFMIADRNITFKRKGKFILRHMSDLTQAGKDLLSLIEPIFSEELFSMTKDEFLRHGLELVP